MLEEISCLQSELARRKLKETVSQREQADWYLIINAVDALKEIVFENIKEHNTVETEISKFLYCYESDPDKAHLVRSALDSLRIAEPDFLLLLRATAFRPWQQLNPVKRLPTQIIEDLHKIGASTTFADKAEALLRYTSLIGTTHIENL